MASLDNELVESHLESGLELTTLVMGSMYVELMLQRVPHSSRVFIG